MAGHLAAFSRAGTSWKTAPCVSLLNPGLCDLVRRFLALCPNTVLPIKKLEHAILSCQLSSPCNLSGMDDNTFAEQVGLICRMLMQKFRMLHDDTNARQVALRKVMQSWYLELRPNLAILIS